VTFTLVGTDPTECDLLVDKYVITDNRCLTDDNPYTMVNKNTPSKFGGRVNVDHGQEHSQCRDETGKKTQPFIVEPVCDTVKEECPQSRIVEKEFKSRVECRVVSFDIGKVFFDQSKKVHALAPWEVSLMA